MGLATNASRPVVVTPTQNYHARFGDAWPEAVFEHSSSGLFSIVVLAHRHGFGAKSGSITAETFAVGVLDGFVTPLRKSGVTGPLLLISDSGGGNLRPPH